jgi:hypothetical protein
MRSNDLSGYFARFKLLLRDEIFSVGKQPRVIEVLCLEDRIVLVPEARGNHSSPPRVLANCPYPKDRSYDVPAHVEDVALKPV